MASRISIHCNRACASVAQRKLQTGSSDGSNMYVWNARHQLVQIQQDASVVAQYVLRDTARAQAACGLAFRQIAAAIASHITPAWSTTLPLRNNYTRMLPRR